MKRALLLIPTMFLGTTLVFCAASGTLAFGAAAETTFDGTYSGSLKPTPGLTGPACAQGAPVRATVIKGQLKSASPQLNGTVNIKAFVQGKMQIGGRTVPMEGRVTDFDGAGDHLMAGVIDAQTNCAWTLELMKEGGSGSAAITSAGRVDSAR